MHILSQPPSILFSLLPSLTWRMPSAAHCVYLTFDDGPHPVTTPLVLDILEQFQAKATFFCLGSQVEAFPEIYQRVLQSGHAVGNHSYSHPDGWRTETDPYCDDVQRAAAAIHSPLFRPPYGRITPAKAKRLRSQYDIILWSRLSMDYNLSIPDEQVIRHCTEGLTAGDILVLHDHERAAERMPRVLPVILEKIKALGFGTDIITPKAR